MRQRSADDDALAVGLRLHQRDAALDQIVEVLVGEGELELAGLDPAQIGEIVDDGDHALAGSADVLHVFDVTLVAERAEPLFDHHFGKSDDGVERRADLMADPRQQVGLGVGRAIGQPPRLAHFALAFLGLRQIAEHGEEIRPLGLRPSHGHRQRDQAAAAHTAQHLAAVLEQAGDALAVGAVEIVLDRAPGSPARTASARLRCTSSSPS